MGQITASPEVCDGLDNDCDGQVDERVDYGICGDSTGECETGRFHCLKGSLVCQGAKEASPEVCDGLDNDCDGQVDEEIPIEFCYTGDPPDSVLNPPCRPGVRECDRGHLVCRSEVTPSLEQCGNLVDDDCDGLVDEAPMGMEIVPQALVFIVDRSGSMRDEIFEVQAGLQGVLVSWGTRDDLHFWLIDLPGAGPGSREYGFNRDCHTSTVAPVLECARNDFQEAISKLTATHAGAEPIYDALYDLATKKLLLEPSGAPIVSVIFFGDEPGQSYQEHTEMEVASLLQEAGIRFYGFVNPEFELDYDDLSSRTGGKLFFSYSGLASLFEATFVSSCR